jgi:serpin B
VTSNSSSTFAFACGLLRALPAGGNVIFSPASVRMALGMALLGARGQSAEDLAAGLRLGETPAADFHAAQAAQMALWSDTTRPYTLVAANAMFIAETLKLRPEAQTALKEGYLAPIHRLDFARDPGAAAGEINRWVDEATRGLIPEIAGEGVLGRDTRLVLTNALHFKAEWRSKFAEDATHPAPFEVPSGERPMVTTMEQTDRYRVSVSPDVEMLEMPYLGEDLAMTFVLPPRGTALSDLESRLDGPALCAWLSRLGEERVRVTLPRFTIDAGTASLRAPLQAMGIRAPFHPASADFGGFFDEPVIVDDVLHRARIGVNEEGTEAAAATAVFAFLSLDESDPPAFSIDRPFLFLLRDRRDGSVLFFGRVTDPR